MSNTIDFVNPNQKNEFRKLTDNIIPTPAAAIAKVSAVGSARKQA